MSQQALPKDTILFGARGSYYIEDVIGRGGFGITYRASCDGDGLPEYVAIKEFFPKEMCSRTPNPDAFDVIIDSSEKFATINKLRDRFIKESRNIESCQHPSIVRVLDTIECNGTAYMVMELVPGRTLKQLLNESTGRVSPQRARDIIEQAAKALEYLHNNKMTHLDVKPDNIMLTNDNRRVVLIDFGLSRRFNDDGTSDSEVLAAVSKGYASPEQYFGITRFSPESDIYSLGATFYKLLTGKTPPEPLELKNHPELLTFPADMPQSYVNAIRRAMAYHTENRLKSADEFIKVMDGQRITRPIVQVPEPPVEVSYDENEYEYDVDTPPSHLVGKIIMSVLLVGVIVACGFLIEKDWGHSAKWHERFVMEISNRDFIVCLAITGGVALVGALSRSYVFKVIVTILTLLSLGFLYAHG